jgi:MerR family transcriptional regulator, thiopeptide resistance regulator
MLTVSKLAQRCGLSRSTVLYYESIGLLPRPPRTQGNYRRYTERDAAHLHQICIYRNAGLALADIREILERPATDASSVLRRRLVEIDAGIEKMREHQWAILRLLKVQGSIRRQKVITKEKWVSIMRAAGFTEADMHRWHAEFEKSAPAEHEEFLQFLHIPADEIRSIREWSRTQ